MLRSSVWRLCSEIERLEALWAQEQKRAERAEGELFAANYDIVNVLEPKIAALMECYTHLTYVADTEKALESIRKVEALLEEK